jgi:quinol-cytochrome oxidoreductase complex cytochrome b subunit
MKISQIAAKAVVRVFLLLLLISTVPFLEGNNPKLQNFQFVVHQKWTLVFPSILIVGFVTLLVLCTIKKYKETDLNWLLVINTLVLLAYFLTVAYAVYRQIS